MKQALQWAGLVVAILLMSTGVLFFWKYFKPRQVKITTPAPKPTGEELLVLEVPESTGAAGRTIYAGVKRDGTLVAWGQGALSATSVVEVAVHLMDPQTQLGNGSYELWASVHRRLDQQTCEPSKGDFYTYRSLKWPKMPRIIRVEGLSVSEKDEVPR